LNNIVVVPRTLGPETKFVSGGGRVQLGLKLDASAP
jgi:hypothetical protein